MFLIYALNMQDFFGGKGDRLTFIDNKIELFGDKTNMFGVVVGRCQNKKMPQRGLSSMH